MALLRLLIAINQDTDEEAVCFTEEFDDPAQDFFLHTFTVKYDQKVECNLPIDFPFDSQLIKQD